MLWKYDFKCIMIALMAEILLIETEKDSPIAEILRTLGHSIIRIYFAEGVAGPEKLERIPDLILWDADIDFSPLRFLQTEHSRVDEAYIPEIVLLRTYDREFLRSWLGGPHFGFLLRPVSESAVISVVENVLNRTSRYLYQEKLEAAKLAAEDANRAKSQFIANMSHELRTPLNIILGFSELLTQEETDPKKQEKLASVERAGKNLLAIINDILDFSQIEAKRLKLEYEPFSLHSMLIHQNTFFERQLQHKQIEFRIEVADEMPHHFYGDQRRVHQIVTNLVSNAIKFTPQGSVVLKADYRDGKVVLQVIDTGIGIDPQQCDRLFHPFEQIDAADNRSYSGTGLGLAIVKSLVEEMEGTVNVDSTTDRGSVFTVNLPLKPVTSLRTQQESEYEKSPDVESESPLHILVAEDNKVNQQLMKMILKNLGYTCDVAPEGQTALEYLQAGRYDLAIIDMHMPVMDGYQLAREIRRDPQLSSLVIIALSAATGKSETDEFLAAGCNDFVHKPVDTTVLDKKIKELI